MRHISSAIISAQFTPPPVSLPQSGHKSGISPPLAQRASRPGGNRGRGPLATVDVQLEFSGPLYSTACGSLGEDQMLTSGEAALSARTLKSGSHSEIAKAGRSI